MAHAPVIPTNLLSRAGWLTVFCLAQAAGQSKHLNWPPNIAPSNLPCDLCHDNNWLLVVATGRSGSTTVMDMLNAIPGVLIVGENDGYITKIGTAFKQLALYPKGTFQKPYSAWWQTTTSFDHLLCNIQSMARNLVGNVDPTQKLTFIGWKEIRYFTIDDLNLITTLFPCAKFVVNYRLDVDSQSQSAFYGVRPDRDAVIRTLAKHNELYIRWAAELGPSRAFTVTLENLTVDTFNQLLVWLGYSNCTYSALIHTNTNNGLGGIPSRQEIEAVIPNREYCRPPDLRAQGANL